MSKFTKGRVSLLCPALLHSLFLINTISNVCWADLSDLKVYSPIIEKGEVGLEILGNTTIDDDAEQDKFQYHELEFEKSITNWWASSITVSLIKPSQETLIFNNFGWENTVQFTEQGKYLLDLGVHFEFEFDDENEKANAFELRLLFEKTINKYEHIFNINFEQQYGSSADESTEIEYIWRTKNAITNHFSIGFEAYGAMGEVNDLSPLEKQQHIIGPALYNDFKIGGLEIETHIVWMFGLTDESADNTIRWQIEFPFN